MLTRTGVGKLTLVDKGNVKMESLGRMYFLPEQVGMSKVQAARIHLRYINPHVTLETLHCDVLNGEVKCHRKCS